MVEPAPTEPTPATTKLDQTIIDAGYELANAQRSDPRDPDRIETARAALLVARAARWPDA